MSLYHNSAPDTGIALGQKHAFAVASLATGIACFINLLGMEKAALAIILGWLALRPAAAPEVRVPRVWARAGIILGAIYFVVIPTLLAWKWDRVTELLTKLKNANP